MLGVVGMDVEEHKLRRHLRPNLGCTIEEAQMNWQGITNTKTFRKSLALPSTSGRCGNRLHGLTETGLRVLF
jgi:hypothetical protein